MFYVLHSSFIFCLADLQSSIYQQVFTNRVGYSVEPDQLASEKPAGLDLGCFQKQDISELSW